jgi:hypothetical protein
MAAKLRHADAHAIAKEQVPGRVLLLMADKLPTSTNHAAAEAVMAVIGISRSETFEYVLDSDPCKKRIPLDVPGIENGEKITEEVVIEEGATVFKLGVLDLFLMGEIYDKSTLVTRNDADHQVGVHTRLNQTNIDAVRFGLKGWTNFPDRAGNDIAFKTVEKVVNGRKYHVVAASIQS